MYHRHNPLGYVLLGVVGVGLVIGLPGARATAPAAAVTPAAVTLTLDAASFIAAVKAANAAPVAKIAAPAAPEIHTATKHHKHKTKHAAATAVRYVLVGCTCGL